MSGAALRVIKVITIIVALFMLLPVAAVFITSLTAGQLAELPPHAWSFHWYGQAVQSDYVSPFIFSVEVAAVVALIAGFIGTSAAIAIEIFRFPGRDAIYALLMAPLMIPYIIIALGLLELASALGLKSSPYALVAGHIVIVLPFVMRVVLTGAESVDRRLPIASRSLGASEFVTLRRVIIPSLAPAIAAACVIAFVMSFDENVVAIFTALPGAETVQVAIFNAIQQQATPLVSAVSSAMVAISLIVIIIVDRFVGLLRLLSGGRLGDTQAERAGA